MGQHPSKDKLSRSSSERIHTKERFGSFGKKGSSKKREVVQVTQVLTASKLSRPAPQNATENNKKTTPTSSLSESKPKRTPPGLKDKKQPAIKGERFTLQLQQ
ncbi:hypothetical protein MTP99_002690 [Tenebrio molitor]|nr:hypothetical protein MTP99_002690 [Tenebrio molitor]